MTLAWAAVAIPLIDAVACGESAPGAWIALAMALVGSAAAFGLHIAATFYFRIPFWYGLLFPLGYAAGALDGARQRAPPLKGTGDVERSGLFMKAARKRKARTSAPHERDRASRTLYTRISASYDRSGQTSRSVNR